jgi:hypothetical protein
MILNHLMLKLKTKNADTLAKVKNILLSMQGKIPPLRKLRVEADMRHGDSSYDLLLIAEFDSMQDFDAYLVHPVHRDVARDIAGHLEAIAAVCFEA